jgi:hypothetical protein
MRQQKWRFTALLGATLISGNAKADNLKTWPIPVWALAITCDDQLNCEKRAGRVPDVVLKHSESVPDCTAYMNVVAGGTRTDADGNVTHVTITCAVSRRAPKGYKLFSPQS